jgi:hypothetical protein
MSITSYLSVLPLNEIVPYNGKPPRDAVTFSGLPRRNPADNSKIILLQDTEREAPVVTEFRMEDVLYIEEIPQPVTEEGRGVPRVKIWVRRGAIGVLLEPFEVESPVNFASISAAAKKRFPK